MRGIPQESFAKCQANVRVQKLLSEDIACLAVRSDPNGEDAANRPQYQGLFDVRVYCTVRLPPEIELESSSPMSTPSSLWLRPGTRSRWMTQRPTHDIRRSSRQQRRAQFPFPS